MPLLARIYEKLLTEFADCCGFGRLSDLRTPAALTAAAAEHQ